MENNLFLDVGNGDHGKIDAGDQTGSSNEIPWNYIITGKNIMYFLIEKVSSFLLFVQFHLW